LAHEEAVPFAAARFRFAGPVYTNANAHYEPHTHEYNELILIQRGRYRIRVDETEHIAVPGDIAVYPVGIVHEEWAEDGAPVLTWACAFYGDLFEKDRPVFCHDAHGRIEVLLACLAAEFFAHIPWTKERSYGNPLLRTILAELNRLMAHEPRAIVELVRAFVRNNIRDPFTLGDLVRISGLSKSHLTRVYRAVTGHSPMEDARLLRVQEAQRLIQTTELPLGEIAPMVGIPNECHLSRLLKSLLGVGVRDLRPPKQTK